MIRTAAARLAAAPFAAVLAVAFLAAQPAAAAPADSRGEASKTCVWKKIGPADQAAALALYRQTGALLKDETFKGKIWDAASACGATDPQSGLAAVLAFNGRIQAQAAQEQLAAAGTPPGRLHEAWAGLPAADRDFSMALGARMTDGGKASDEEMSRFDAVLGAYAKALGIPLDGPVSDHLVVYVSGHFMSGDPI